MTVSLKTAEDIAGMRIAGKLAADVLEMIAEHVKPGVTNHHDTDEVHSIPRMHDSPTAGRRFAGLRPGSGFCSSP